MMECRSSKGRVWGARREQGRALLPALLSGVLLGPGHKLFLESSFVVRDGGHALYVLSVGMQNPGRSLIGQGSIENVQQAIFVLRIFDLHDRFDAVVEVAAHPVGTADVELKPTSLAK
jgi:hypothetical protein